MRINLYDVLSVIGKEQTIEGFLESLKVTFQGEVLEVVGTAPFSILLRHMDKDIVSVEFDTMVSVIRPCSRCLDEVISSYELKVRRTIHVAKKQAYADNALEYDEISYIEDCTLDVDMLILDELYTLIPMSVLCKDSCRGICKVCGTNLNKNTCDCNQTVPDPRMAVFSDIFNEFKEV